MAEPQGFVPMGAPAGFQPDTPEPIIRNPTMWERARTAGTRVLEHVPLPPGAARPLAEFFIPGTNTEAGIQAALMAAPLVGPALGRAAPTLAKEAPTLFNLLQRSGRIALPAAGGAIGATTEGRSPMSGAAKGALVGGVGEAIPLAAEWAGRGLGKGVIEKQAAAGLGKTIGESATTLPKMKTVNDIVQTAVRDTGMAAIGEAHDKALNDISAKLMAREVTGGRFMPGRTPIVGRQAGHDVIEVPALQGVAGTSQFKFRDAVGWLKTLADEGWLISQREKSGVDAVQARALRAKAREQIVQALDQSTKGLGTEFNRAQNLYDKGRLYVDLFRQPGVLKDGHLDINALRETMGKTDKSGTHTWAQAIDRANRGTPQEAEAFFRALFRGGPMTGRDAPGELGLHVGFSRGPHVGLRPPHPPSYAGADLPRWARPGGLGAASAPISFTTLGLTREREPD